jgi:cytochrome c oxidase cbb3-type subunit 3
MTVMRSTVVGVASLVCLVGCWREERLLRPPSVDHPPTKPVMVTERASRPLGGGRSYENNAWGISEGQQLFNWFNCVGCHGRGGGGSGPALMDPEWIYGSVPTDVFASIAEGRPNGMPAFGNQLSNDQIWKLVAYVRSLARLERGDTFSVRSDSMAWQSTEQPR